LCALNSDYLWFIIVYTGKKAVLESLLISKDTLKTEAAFLKLCGTPLYKWYTLWLDNYHNSLPLARFLKSCYTGHLWTVKMNRKETPQDAEG